MPLTRLHSHAVTPRDDEKARRMWNMYLDREDSKVVGKWSACAGGLWNIAVCRCGVECDLPSVVSSPRPVCGTAEKLHDVHRLRLPLHHVWSILGPVHPCATGEAVAVACSISLSLSRTHTSLHPHLGSKLSCKTQCLEHPLVAALLHRL